MLNHKIFQKDKVIAVFSDSRDRIICLKALSKIYGDDFGLNLDGQKEIDFEKKPDEK